MSYDYFGVFNLFSLRDIPNEEWAERFSRATPENNIVFEKKETAMRYAIRVRDWNRDSDRMSRNPNKGRRRVVVKACDALGNIKGMAMDPDFDQFRKRVRIHESII